MFGFWLKVRLLLLCSDFRGAGSLELEGIKRVTNHLVINSADRLLRVKRWLLKVKS